MIVLLDRVSDALERGRGMIELACNLDFQLGMSHHRVIVNGDAAIGGDELSIFGQHQWINFERTGFNTARSGK